MLSSLVASLPVFKLVSNITIKYLGAAACNERALSDVRKKINMDWGCNSEENKKVDCNTNADIFSKESDPVKELFWFHRIRIKFSILLIYFKRD